MDALLDFAAVILPKFLAIVGVFVSIETPRLETNRARLAWRIGLFLFGVIVSCVTWKQQQVARENAANLEKRLDERLSGGDNYCFYRAEIRDPWNVDGSFPLWLACTGSIYNFYAYIVKGIILDPNDQRTRAG